MYGISMEPGAPWPAVDAINRPVAAGGAVPAPRKDRFVGIFYFLWHTESGSWGNPDGGPYDLTKIFAKDPDAMKNHDSPYWSPRNGQSYYWGEPLYGYYLSDDPWVLRRHARLLSEAGVDTLIFDTTNAVTYKPIYMKLCEVFTQIRAEGGRTPQIAFMVNTHAGRTAEEIYNDLYKPGLYKPLWFMWQGKPLLICDPKEANDELKRFFTLRRAHWPFTMVNTPYAWHWEAAYPQPYGYTDNERVPEQVNVSVAQNLRASDGKVTDMSSGLARGRGFANGKQHHTVEAIHGGWNAEEQWKRVYELDPPFVMITGWNEWWAGRWQRGNDFVFVDQFDQEYSRDIEPMRGGHHDNFYYQMVSHIRRYKGAPALPRSSPAISIDVTGSFDQWRTVAPDYRTPRWTRQARDHQGAGELHYRDASWRNQFLSVKVARDDKDITFYAEMAEPLAPLALGTWLLLDVDQQRSTGWEGYDFIINRERDGGAMWLERHVDGWRWERVCEVKHRIDGNQIMISIPRAKLGIGQTQRYLDFKWVDNMQKPGDIMDWYVSGDTAPIGRFNYRYQLR